MKASSARVDAILSLLEPCSLLADVGTDHGLVPVLAVARGRAERAIAADLRSAPLAMARRQVARAGIGERVALLQGDGLLALEDQGVDAVVLAGMSGGLMRQLCEAAPHVLRGVRQLLVQPNKDAEVVRAWALEHAWHLREERWVEERGRAFLVCALSPGVGRDPAYSLAGWTEALLLRVGPLLARRKDPLARRECEEQRARLLGLVRGGARGCEPALLGFQAACARMR